MFCLGWELGRPGLAFWAWEAPRGDKWAPRGTHGGGNAPWRVKRFHNAQTPRSQSYIRRGLQASRRVDVWPLFPPTPRSPYAFSLFFQIATNRCGISCLLFVQSLETHKNQCIFNGLQPPSRESSKCHVLTNPTVFLD